MRKQPPNPKVYLILAALTVVGGGFLGFMQYNNLGELESKIEALKKDGKDGKSISKDLADSDLKVVDLKKQLAHLEENIPDFAYIPTMLKELETTGKSFNLKVLGVRPIAKVVPAGSKAKTVVKKTYDDQDIEVKCRGTYANIVGFVKSLNAFPKIVAVRSVSMEPKAQPGQLKDKSLEVSVLLRAYLFPAGTPKVNADTAGQSTPASLNGKTPNTATPSATTPNSTTPNAPAPNAVAPVKPGVTAPAKKVVKATAMGPHTEVHKNG